MKIISITILLIFGVFSCTSINKDLLEQAEYLIESDPDAALKCLDSIENNIHLNLKQTASYQLLKWHGTFLRDGDLEAFIPIMKLAEYWQKQENKRKTAYSYFYNGVISLHSKLYEQATICFNEAQEIAKNQGDSSLMFYTFYYQGKLYFKNREKINGEEACLNALKYYPFHNSNKYPYSLLMVAECYLYNKKFEEANNCYSQLQQTLENKQDSILTAKMLFKARHNSRSEEVKNRILTYLKNKFEKDSSTMVYSKLARAGIYLRNNKLDSARICLDEIPLKTISDMPELLLQYYRTKGYYYFQMGDGHKALQNFRQYIHYNDSTQNYMFNTKINSIVSQYTQMKFEDEVKSLRNRQIILLLGIIILLLTSLLIVIVSRISKRKKEQEILEAGILIDTLQELCTVHKNQQNEFKNLLLNKLAMSRKLVLLSSQEIPKNISFLKVYNEMMGDLHPADLDWNELYHLIDGLYDNFHKKLPEHFPELTEKEIQACCLLCGGFKTDEIAFVMKQTVFSVHKRKTTIRKKLNLEDRSDIITELMKLFK